jgi:hypothetical protein
VAFVVCALKRDVLKHFFAFQVIAAILRNHAIDKILKRIDNSSRPMWSFIGF